jgi:multiple sugar transport system ATP-binding protein
MLRLSGVRVTYGATTALDGIDLEVRPSERLAVLGPSGSGKSTVLRAIAGLEPLDGGVISWDGQDLAGVPVHKRGFGLMFQDYVLFPHRDVAGNVGFGLEMHGDRVAQQRTRVEEVLALVGLPGYGGRRIDQLSGGEQQRVALGRSLVRHPKILLLDEPLTNLDAKLRHDMRAELKRLHRQFGMTIVYATPDELEALSMGEEIAVMRDGAVVQRGTPEELYERPINTYVAGKIGSPHMNMFQAKVGRDAKSFETPLGKMSPKMPRKTAAAGEAAIIGIRPSDIRLAAKGEKAIASKIHLLEPLGDITIVSVETGSEVLRMVLPEAKATSIKVGDPAAIFIDPNDIHIFRAVSGQVMT